jgi:catechol 2,3-dioxygenase-like lactoylglutathione lyase family enzyme
MAIPSGNEIARPFLPSRDFEKSAAFYTALGFRKVLEDEEIAVFVAGASSFILQRYYEQAWAENCMMQLLVDDVDAWFAHLESLDLAGTFGVLPPRPPELQPWGLRVSFVWDPSGVLWHVAERRRTSSPPA